MESTRAFSFKHLVVNGKKIRLVIEKIAKKRKIIYTSNVFLLNLNAVI